MNWEEANKWESTWWGDCTDTVNEEIKQRTYAKKIGLSEDFSDKTILDIGGGPVSLLLKHKIKKVMLLIRANSQIGYPKGIRKTTLNICYLKARILYQIQR